MLSERQKEIFDLLCDKTRMSVEELSKIFYVSEMTIRRDLNEMKEQGLLKRYRGGAMVSGNAEEFPVSQRMFYEEEEKRLLCSKAQNYLSDNKNIFVDCSSTCQFLIPYIKKYNNIKVITNSAGVLLSTAKLHIPCFVIGGEYYEQDMCFIGSIAEQTAGNLNVDIAFFSVQGMSEEGVLYDSNIAQTRIRQIIMSNSEKNIVLMEKSKVGKRFLHTVCSQKEVDEIIRI